MILLSVEHARLTLISANKQPGSLLAFVSMLPLLTPTIQI